MEHYSRDIDFLWLEREACGSFPNVAIDVAVMGKTDRSDVLPLAAGWSDMASWSALWGTAEGDAAGNVSRGRLIRAVARNCYLRSKSRSWWT